MRRLHLLLLGALCTAPARGQWSTLNLPTPRLAPSGTALGSKAFFAAGNPGPAASSETDVVEIYDASTGMWSTTFLSAARSGVAATSVGTKALFAGGWDSVFFDVVDVYDEASGTWSTHSMQQFGSVAAASTRDKAFFGGGYVGPNLGGPYSAAVTIYDDASGAWSQASLSAPRTALSAAAVGTKVIFAGGLGPTGLSNVVDIYDDATGAWTTATLSIARADMAAVTVGTKVLFAGGHSGGPGGGVTTRVDIYDDATGAWSTAELSEARQIASGVAVGPLALIGGGAVGLTSTSATVDVYDDRTGLWSVTQLSQDRVRPGVAALCNRALFAGGTSLANQDNAVIDVFTFPEDVGQPYCAPGVDSSTGVPGLLCARGSAAAVGGQVTLLAHELPPGRFSVFLVAPTTGTTPAFGGGSGTLCLGPAWARYLSPGAVQPIDADGTRELTVDPAQTPTPAGPTAIAAGETWHFQCWFRDRVGGTGTSNLTHGLSVTFF